MYHYNGTHQKDVQQGDVDQSIVSGVQRSRS